MIAMAEDAIDFTRGRFNRAGAKLDRVLDALEQVTMRLSSLEEQVSIQRREIGPMREDFIRLEHRIDGNGPAARQNREKAPPRRVGA